jgi:hypothetical protein
MALDAVLGEGRLQDTIKAILFRSHHRQTQTQGQKGCEDTFHFIGSALVRFTHFSFMAGL